MFDSLQHSDPKAMMARIHALIDEADAVIHYNGSKFDMPILNKEFLLHGLPPPSSVQQIDLLKTVRRRFRLSSNKLDFVAQALGLGKKTTHKGFSLWIGCMNNDPASWRVMQKYNKQDVVLLEKLYYELLPWISGHPNVSVFNGELCCPHCGGYSYQRRGVQHTKAGTYQRFKCSDCHTPFRGVHNEAPREKFVEIA